MSTPASGCGTCDCGHAATDAAGDPLDLGDKNGALIEDLHGLLCALTDLVDEASAWLAAQAVAAWPADVRA